ncbi:MAG TPA: hypothetical protein DDY31_09805 [Lachnospiraceae bacterium]|nr:hypothetical protein [Lachnospiraceae bacterium]
MALRKMHRYYATGKGCIQRKCKGVLWKKAGGVSGVKGVIKEAMTISVAKVKTDFWRSFGDAAEKEGIIKQPG